MSARSQVQNTHKTLDWTPPPCENSPPALPPPRKLRTGTSTSQPTPTAATCCSRRPMRQSRTATAGSPLPGPGDRGTSSYNLVLEKKFPVLGRLWYLIKGPDVSPQCETSSRHSRPAPTLSKAQKLNVFTIKIEPDIVASREAHGSLAAAGLVKAPNIQSNDSTALLDISAPENEVLPSPFPRAPATPSAAQNVKAAKCSSRAWRGDLPRPLRPDGGHRERQGFHAVAQLRVLRPVLGRVLQPRPGTASSSSTRTANPASVLS